MTNVTELKPAPDPFDEFWKAYPSCRRVDKLLCRAKFAAITSEDGLQTRMMDREAGSYFDVHLKATADELIKGAKRYDRNLPMNADYSYAEPQFVRHPNTWMNRGGWED